MRGTWQTTEGGGSGLGAAAVIAAAVIAVPVIAALARLAEVFVITLGAVVVLALAAGTTAVALRLRHGRAIRTTRVSFPKAVPRQGPETLSAPRPPAVEAPREVHLHFHGIGAEDVAEILARVNREDR
jgi:hypothetical protein